MQVFRFYGRDSGRRCRFCGNHLKIVGVVIENSWFCGLICHADYTILNPRPRDGKGLQSLGSLSHGERAKAL